MINSRPSRLFPQTKIGISSVSIFRPPWVLSNEWFESIPRKFVKHTGILNRHVSTCSEVDLAIAATEKLVCQTGCDLHDCAGVIFTSPSFIPYQVARKYLGEAEICQEEIDRAANQFIDHLQIRPRGIVAVNTYCAGYARALSIAKNKVLPTIQLKRNEFILVINSNRISRITNYSCSRSSALFGDMASATMLSRVDSFKYPVHLELLAADVQEQATNRPFFDFSMCQNVPTPSPCGGKGVASDRIVFSLDGLGIADAAPRAMARAANQSLVETGWKPEEVDCIIPHQAGSAIVRFSEMKLRESGFNCEVVNEMSRDVGNVSSCSVPFALRERWSNLDGNILCPVAGVGPPGKPVVMQGCIALRKMSTRHAAAG